MEIARYRGQCSFRKKLVKTANLNVLVCSMELDCWKSCLVELVVLYRKVTVLGNKKHIANFVKIGNKMFEKIVL